MGNIKGSVDLENLHRILEEMWREKQDKYKQKRKGERKREAGKALNADNQLPYLTLIAKQKDIEMLYTSLEGIYRKHNKRTAILKK